MPKKFVPEVGQIIYVNTQWFTRNEPNLTEYRVTKVNTASVYAVRADKTRETETRFNKRTMTADDGFGFDYIAYETAEEYWDQVKSAKEKREKVEWILQNIKTVPMSGLVQIEEVIKSGRK
ncbi:hypothetical protein [Terribacillus sp. JSM ZJ617]|uniref:beta barrel domain-containing protein n=1 Tax=Terribacillus sp. JSM ZJ617 TaxID=3342119 RepID=UPI0035A8DD94